MKYWLHGMISFTRGMGHFQQTFQREGASPTNQCWCQKTRVIAVLCGIKVSAVHHLVLSQYTHLTDGQTDGQTNGQTDGQTELWQQYRALHYTQLHLRVKIIHKHREYWLNDKLGLVASKNVLLMYNIKPLLHQLSFIKLWRWRGSSWHQQLLYTTRPTATVTNTYYWLVHRGRTSVIGRRTFPVLRSICSWWVTTYVGKPSAIGQPTRPTKPFILSRSIN